jgi:sterol desaturase/sphingolipid hydroxylase (fatty acid hydroxylase superfamily)
VENPELNTLSPKKKKFLLLVLFILIPVIGLIVFYYRHKLSLIISDPKAFLDLFLTATQLKDFTIMSVLTTLAICATAMIIDLLLTGWKNSGLRKLVVNPSHSSKIDLFCFFLAMTRLFETIQLFFSLGIAYFLSSIFIRYFSLHLFGSLKHPILQPLILFVLLDLKHYLEHRFMHIPKLWELHSYHHSATEFTLFTNARGHFLEESIYSFFTVAFFAIMGVPIQHLFWVYFFREVYAYVLHADIKSKFGWVGKWILISPPAHKLHHSIKKEDYGRNFGTLFIWWDKLFGTYKEPQGEIQIGLYDNIYNEMNLLKGQILSFKRWINSW